MRSITATRKNEREAETADYRTLPATILGSRRADEDHTRFFPDRAFRRHLSQHQHPHLQRPAGQTRFQRLGRHAAVLPADDMATD
ncbi:hypothetical protein DESC_390009 [Desulfosarcina cetonica]|nr:hypothetical protein DESC_390009 [Desulfosarcina cetonica]